MTTRNSNRLSNLEYHVLLSLAQGSQYGYAIKDSVESESAGTLTPRAGSLYRVLARLMTRALVAEVEAEQANSPHPGLARKYYGLTTRGRETLAEEAQRLKGAAALAQQRLGLRESRS